MRYQHYNKIKRALTHPENNQNHLPILKKLVDNFRELYGDSNLADLLRSEYLLTELKVIL